MMKLLFSGNPQSVSLLERGAHLLLEDCPRLSSSSLTLRIHLLECRDGARLEKKGQDCTISYSHPSLFFSLFNYVLRHPEEDVRHSLTPCFEKRGFMLDCSRNTVATPEKVKSIIRTLARMGMNQLFLYMEETYQVNGHPYFGAYRGRYTKEELKELDQYGALLGIELIPCIQTLGHLSNFLKWPEGDSLKDTSDILMVGNQKVYDFIGELLASLKECFSSRSIHLGMDEAHLLGLGNYLKKNGYRKSSLLMKEHCEKVLNLCQDLDLEPMVWSDMYITSNTGKGYYDVDSSTDTYSWEKPDSNLGLVYWDYYNTDPRLYDNMLRIHQELSPKVIFAGGVWNWNGISPNYGKALTCTKTALTACKAHGIRQVLATAWMDNGGETPIDALYPGLAYFSYLCFHQEVKEEDVSLYFRDCTGGNLEDFWLLDSFDALFCGQGKNIAADNPSKYLLYQDAMLGMFDYHIRNIDTQTYYSTLAQKLEQAVPRNPGYEKLLDFYRYLALVLSQKADLGIRIKSAYDFQDLSTLREISQRIIPNILENLGIMKSLREELWMCQAKPFGYELLDIKLGGVEARLKSHIRRIESYVSGDVNRLEELEQERLPYWPDSGRTELRENLWNRIVSGCNLIDTV